MFRVRGYVLAAAAAMLAAAPAMAASAAVNPASSLSVSRAHTATSHDNDLRGRGGVVIAIVALAAVIAGIVIVADDNDTPDSP